METRIKAHYLLAILVICMCFVRVQSASGQSGNYNGFEWEKSGNAATITGYTGPGGVVTVPGTIPYGSTNLTVTSIGTGAFFNSHVTNITIPDSVTSIEEEAFSYSQLTSITVPDSVTSIGFEAFLYCDSLTNAVLGSGVTNIGTGAFANCYNLTGINIPNGVISIGMSAFNTCEALTSIAIPDNVINIGVEAFQDDSGLTNVTIGSGVATIGDQAFSICHEVSAYTVAPENSFYSSLGGVLFDKSQTTLIQFPAGAVGGSYAIPVTVTNIGDYAFVGCTNLTNVIISDSVISINTNAFFFCLGLTSIIIPDSITKIGFGAFLQCEGLTNVTIPDSVASIGDNAFSYCTSLASITIPASVSGIDEYAFANCYDLQSIYFQGDPPAADSSVFNSDSDVTAYCLPGTTGWSAFSAETGIPVALWMPQIQTSASGFGVQTNQFGFNINWTSGQTVTIEACTNLFSPDWQPLQTNTLADSSLFFSDPQATNYPSRFYRIISP